MSLAMIARIAIGFAAVIGIGVAIGGGAAVSLATLLVLLALIDSGSY